jgi:hypothetical protein
MFLFDFNLKKVLFHPRSSPPFFGGCGALGAVLRRRARPFCSCLGWPLHCVGPPPRSRGLRFFWRREQLPQRQKKSIFYVINKRRRKL